MRAESSLNESLARWQSVFLFVFAGGLVLCCLAAAIDIEQFLRSYLVGFLFWWSVTVGCLGLLMLSYLVGGHWSAAARPCLESGSLLAPMSAAVFLPVALGLESIYPWTNVATISPQKAIYLNPQFFCARAVGYFAVWSLLAWLLRSRPSEAPTDRPRWRRLLSAGGLVLLILSITFAAIDWGMSLEPAWFSSIYGALIAIGGALAGLAWVTLVSASLENQRDPSPRLIATETLADLGTLMLAFLMLWAYFAFSQFLIIWSGNLPEENFWYVNRLNGGWQWVGLVIAVFQFFVPFFLLLSRDLKHNPRTLAGIALLVFVMQYVNVFWMIGPAFHPDALFIHWADIIVPGAIGGLWVSGFLWLLRRRVPRNLEGHIT